MALVLLGTDPAMIFNRVDQSFYQL